MTDSHKEIGRVEISVDEFARLLLPMSDATASKGLRLKFGKSGVILIPPRTCRP